MDNRRHLIWVPVMVVLLLVLVPSARAGYEVADDGGWDEPGPLEPVVGSGGAEEGFVVDHTCRDITDIPQAWIEQAKRTLHIGFGHTSYGSQLTTGMAGLIGFANRGGLGLSLPDDIFRFRPSGNDGGDVLHLYEGDGYGDGDLDHDLGYYPRWVNETHEYLGTPDPVTGRGQNHPEMNVLVWSWCSRATDYTAQDMLERYLTPMSELEADYPGVTFVYMTMHSDGSGEEGNVHQLNQQIRQYCVDNDKVLYDYYDIELHDPDGSYYGDKDVNDNCDYDSNRDGSRDRNWAIEWQTSHTLGEDWYGCGWSGCCMHSQPLNCNLKAYAAWWLWARLAGWEGPQDTLELRAPTAGTIWPIDSEQEIRWATTGHVPQVELTYSTDGFTSTQVISSSILNGFEPGVFTWMTPSTPTHSAQVRIAGTGIASGVSDTSDPFTFYDPTTVALPLVLSGEVGLGDADAAVGGPMRSRD